MKLRKRSAAENTYTEDTSEDSDSSHSECASSDEDLYVPMQRSKEAGRVKNRRERVSAPVRKPEILELALQHLDIRRCFDEKCLKSLRLTSKKIKELVEDAGALTQLQFSGRGHKIFDEYLAHPASYQRAESMSIVGKLAIQQGVKFIQQTPPKLKKLKLHKTSDGTEVLLCALLPHLTSFTLDNCSANALGGACKALSKVAWPLEELEMSSLEPAAADLVPILANFPDLRMLRISNVRCYGKVSVATLEEGLQKLEVLELFNVKSSYEDILELRLFHENLQLPSLHTLKFRRYENVHCLNHMLLHCSWVKQLRSLALASYFSEIPSETIKALTSVLEGGPLESLTVHNCSNSDTAWNFVSLPNLSRLDLCFKVSDGNFFEFFSTASFPKLKVATIKSSLNARPYSLSISSNGIENFATAFPRLRSLSLLLQDIIVSPAVVCEIFIQLLPHLENFTLDCCKAFDEESGQINEDDIVDIFGTDNEEEATSATAKWPRLKKLNLDLKCANRSINISKSTYPVAVAEQLVSAAHHCPMLSHLCINQYYYMGAEERLNNMAATLIETNAWPLMKYLSGSLAKVSSLHALWPRAYFN